jgi:hypothetical protein
MQYKQSYRQKLDEEKAALAANGLVSERYSGVLSIEVRMTYYHRSVDPVLMERTLSFLPAHYASFHMKCEQDGCTDGGYDLTPVIAGMAKSRKKSVKGRIFCHGTNHTIGHASIAYEVNMQFTRQVKEKPSGVPMANSTEPAPGRAAAKAR